jgi:hypothetical protein
MKIRVVFVGFNRPEFFARVAASWAPALAGGSYDPVLFLEPSAEASQMREIFAPYGEVRLNDEVRGINTNNWSAINAVFDEDPTLDAVVLAEDDVVVSDDVMAYFEWALAEYVNDQQVMTVGAFEALPCCSGLSDDLVVRHRWFWPWVWGVWRDRWAERLRGSWAFDPTIQGWDDRVWRLMDAAGMVSIVPAGSRADHIGTSGVHMVPELMDSTRARDFALSRPVRHSVFREWVGLVP